MTTKKKDLVVINGNDGQLPQIYLFLKTLRDPDKGAFLGEVAVVSTELSAPAVRWLEARKVQVFQKRITRVLDHWPLWRKIAAFEKARKVVYKEPFPPKRQRFQILSYFLAQGDREEWVLWVAKAYWMCSWFDTYLHTELRQEFDLWHRKHLSKLNVIPLLDSQPNRWRKVMVCDSDMIFQGPVDALFSQVPEGKICIREEVEPLIPEEQGGSPVTGSNQWAIDKSFSWAKSLQMGAHAHEVNVGVFLGSYETVLQRMKEWETLMFDRRHAILWTCHRRFFWHEQDFFRLLRDLTPNGFFPLGPEWILHGCGKGVDLVEQLGDDSFAIRDKGVKPVIMHFAGGVWRQFQRIQNVYNTKFETILNEEIQ